MIIDHELVELLRALVAIPSVSQGLASDPATAREARLANYCAEYLRKLGCSIRLLEVEPGRPNLLASYGPADAKRRVVFCAHLDTVDVAGFTGNPWLLRQDGDNRLYGRGACDCKGPMAAGLWAARGDILARLARAGVSWQFVGTIGEETGTEGAKKLAADGLLNADMLIVLEPTDLSIVYAHKGTLWIRLEVQGVAAHGSQPDHGLNAIYAMMPVIDFIRQKTEQDRELFPNHPLGGPTVNIGTIHGGQAPNIVPDSCTIEIDRRLLPEEDPLQVAKAIEEKLSALTAAGTIRGYKLDSSRHHKSFAGPATGELVKKLQQAAHSIGRQAQATTAPWFSDAGVLAPSCGQTVVFGPGSINEAHTANEFIAIDQLQGGAGILRAFLEELARENI